MENNLLKVRMFGGFSLEFNDKEVVLDRNAVPLEESDKQSALHISKTEDGTVAEDVTAESNADIVSSSGFSF